MTGPLNSRGRSDEDLVRDATGLYARSEYRKGNTSPPVPDPARSGRVGNTVSLVLPNGVVLASFRVTPGGKLKRNWTEAYPRPPRKRGRRLAS